MQSNDSPEIPDKGETSDIPGLPLGDFNTEIFSDTINVMNAIKVKLCTLVLHIELYLFITLSVTLVPFQGHSSVKQ